MDDFIVNALLAGIALALVAGPLGCVVVWRRMAYFGDTLAHSSLLGVALAVSVEQVPILGVVFIGAVLAALLFWLEQRRELSPDTLLGILSHSALALGLIVFSLIQSRVPGIDLMAYLFGDILAVNQTEIIWMYLAVIFILSVFVGMWRPLISISVNEDMARTDGINVSLVRFVFMLLLAMVIAAAIKVVGILLITALLIIPAASARAFASTPVQMALLSTLIAVTAVVLGVGASFYQDLPAGPAIVVAAALVFFMTRISRARY
ncbi:MAG: iron chelate uptake ABC transporter family permease subunit [Gammaproteobacteria bacterium]|jgi:zinc transport system permease protein